MDMPTHRKAPKTSLKRLALFSGLLLASMAGFTLQTTRAQSIPVKPRDAVKNLKSGVVDKTKKLSTQTIRQGPSKGKTKIKIEGLRDMSEREAILLLGNIIDEIVSHAPTQSRADDCAFLLETTLRRSGYPEADVEWALIKKRNIIKLIVNQGPTRNIGNITVTGIPDDITPIIAAYFKTEPSGFQLVANDSVPYIPKHMLDAVDNATSYLQSEGYWLAHVEISNTKIPDDTGTVDIPVRVNPGPLYLIAPTQLQGTSPLPLAPLKKKLAKFTGLPANTNNILDAQSAAVHYFTSRGYTFAAVSMDRHLMRNRAHLTFTITVGEKYLIGNVSFSGLEHTDPAVLKRRFDRITGRPYDPEKMELNKKKLLSTGAFKAITIDTHPQIDGTIDLSLKMEEGKARGISTFLGADSFEGGIFGLGYHDRNFLGKLQSLSVSAQYSGLGLLGRASITEPLFLGSDRSVTLGTFLLSHEFDGYKKLEAGLGLELVWTITDHYSARFYGDGIIATTTSAGLPDYALGYDDYTVLRTGVTQKLDYRNSPLSPNKGFHGELTIETGVVNGDSVLPYSRAIVRTSYRQPINKIQYLAFSGQAGAIFCDDAENFPVDLRFFSGGPDSIRSFPRREMGPTANGNYKGGEAFWQTSIEYNRKVKGPLWTNIFVDAGSLAEFTDNIGATDTELAVGLGLWLDLPIGPVRAEYGYNLTRDAGEPAGTFHFTIGVNF